jgi:hypothetical protein
MWDVSDKEGRRGLVCIVKYSTLLVKMKVLMTIACSVIQSEKKANRESANVNVYTSDIQ